MKINWLIFYLIIIDIFKLIYISIQTNFVFKWKYNIIRMTWKFLKCYYQYPNYKHEWIYNCNYFIYVIKYYLK
jgi:hypothetical protein